MSREQPLDPATRYLRIVPTVSFSRSAGYRLVKAHVRSCETVFGRPIRANIARVFAFNMIHSFDPRGRTSQKHPGRRAAFKNKNSASGVSRGKIEGAKFFVKF